MLPELTDKVTLYALLHRMDQDLAEQVQAGGCGRCGGVLHRATWLRKPRGGPRLPEEYSVRLGLCCAQCRRRALPPSTLFFGRRVYWGIAVLVVMALRQGTPRWSLAALRRLLGVSRQTTKRWVAWFATAFAAGARWKRLRARLGGLIDDARLPTAILERFEATVGLESAMASSLEFLAVGAPPGEHAQ